MWLALGLQQCLTPYNLQAHLSLSNLLANVQNSPLPKLTLGKVEGKRSISQAFKNFSESAYMRWPIGRINHNVIQVRPTVRDLSRYLVN